jgi:hypothetical protein
MWFYHLVLETLRSQSRSIKRKSVALFDYMFVLMSEELLFLRLVSQKHPVDTSPLSAQVELLLQTFSQQF